LVGRKSQGIQILKRFHVWGGGLSPPKLLIKSSWGAQSLINSVHAKNDEQVYHVTINNHYQDFHNNQHSTLDVNLEPDDALTDTGAADFKQSEPGQLARCDVTGRAETRAQPQESGLRSLRADQRKNTSSTSGGNGEAYRGVRVP